MTPLLAQRPRVDRAFERLYRQNVREVYRYALVVLRSPEDAEDVAQTTFLNAYRVFLQGERFDSPRTRLIGIAHELCQQRARQEARLDEVDLEEQVAEAVPDEEGPTRNDMQRALGRLRFDQRAALIMREVEGRSYAEIAQILNVSLPAVESSDLPGPPRPARRARGRAHLPRGRACDLPSPGRPAQALRAPGPARPRSGVRGLRRLRTGTTLAARCTPRSGRRVAPAIALVVLRREPGSERLAEQNVGFAPRRHLLCVGDSGLLASSSWPGSSSSPAGRRSGGGVLLCVTRSDDG